MKLLALSCCESNLLAKSLLHCNEDLFHVRCAAHVLNFIVKNCLEVIDGVINDIRESVKYIKGSTSTKENFEEVIVVMDIDCGSRPTLNVRHIGTHTIPQPRYTN